MFGLKFTLSAVTLSFLPDNLPGFEQNYIQAWNKIPNRKRSGQMTEFVIQVRFLPVNIHTFFYF